VRLVLVVEEPPRVFCGVCDQLITDITPDPETD
jgi:hypothetical protein